MSPSEQGDLNSQSSDPPAKMPSIAQEQVNNVQTNGTYVKDTTKNGVLTNGTTKYGREALTKILNTDNLTELSADHELVLKTLRLLVADLCQQFNGGHPGGAIGMMAIGTALWRYVMKYSPNSPNWFNRDRFVLSNGHTCLFQYIFLHMTGYHDMTLEQLKSYHSTREDALCPGHPEIEHEGIEVTTGPLGQGIANAVGFAIATKHLAATYNQPGFDVVDNHTWCMVGDACLQEGVALEAISYAGHLKLNNLTVMYDNNQITCDGSVDLTNTEDVNAKFRACGWNVIDVPNGSYDIEGIIHALHLAKRSTDKPTFINIPTVIGLGSAVAGNAIAHGAAFGAKDVAAMKKAYEFSPEEYFHIPQAVRDFFAPVPKRGDRLVAQWEDLLSEYTDAHPELAAEFKMRLTGALPKDWKSTIPTSFSDVAMPTRASNGFVLNPLAEKYKSFMVGTADLVPSVYLKYPTGAPLNPPNLTPISGPKGSYADRFLHFGIREHAMASISNGLAAYHRHPHKHNSSEAPGQAIIPITSTFFMFYLYAAPGVRMGALQNLQVLHAATHDSIGMGEDGPTHQPIELPALYRAMPNFLYFRPADSEETAGAWEASIEFRTGSSLVSTSRHKLKQTGLTKRSEVAKGAYVVQEVEDADLTLIGVGAEFEIAFSTKQKLEEQGLKVRLVSFPCQRLFDHQDISYRRQVLGRGTGKNIPSVVIEAYAAFGWEKYADAAVCMSTDRFGQSLPGPKAYEYFGFTTEKIVPKVQDWLSKRKSGDILPGEFTEIVERRGH